MIVVGVTCQGVCISGRLSVRVSPPVVYMTLTSFFEGPRGRAGPPGYEVYGRRVFEQMKEAKRAKLSARNVSATSSERNE